MKTIKTIFASALCLAMAVTASAQNFTAAKVGIIEENAFAKCPDLTIFCSKDSIAHKYAMENGLNFKIVKNQPNQSFVKKAKRKLRNIRKRLSRNA